tara:strand:- start:403 stop:1185 length:783 start_codon:yes stop_codon:yes gene_type:complete
MKPKKSLGQNFLTDNKLLSRIAEYGNISNTDTVLEIGPGTGNLTRKLINKNPAELIAIEKDNELSKLLYKRFDSKIKIFNKDILLTYKSFKFNKPIIVFGNLPYNISTKILVSFIKLENLNKTYKKFIFIFQKEVADRIIAQENTKNYGRLSILSSWKMHVEKVMDINPNYFFPKPKVWSSLLIFTPKFKFEKLKKPESLEHLTNIFFNQRRKMIKRPMRQLFTQHEEVAKNLNLDLNLRPQNLSINKYLEICKIYEKLS